MSQEKEQVSPISSGKIVPLEGMYQDYFLDYASYVILERAVPGINDGLKPVQRRILYSMKEKDDGRYHKVANLIGHTMQYHPHGDAAIGDALVNLGQKDLLIDCQGNWGDYRTGDSAAAPRYIEARLTKFALDIAFNPQTTEWQMSYDGRNKEPINLPMKFPLVLAQGVDGIAVGLSTKILPHNFGELIKASISHLKGKRVKIYPDFQHGGSIDVSDYNGGKRGGKVKVRAKIEIVDKNTLAIRELPYGITTNNLIDSILKANEKGKIKIKKVIDNTAKDVEILLELQNGISPDLTLDALYAFTNCGISISPNACVIIDNKPHFLTVEEILRTCTDNTKNLLGLELEIKKKALEEKWHMASLEKIFIENRIYRDIEECESWEEVLETIDKGLKKYVATPSDKVKKGDSRLQLHRDITEEDITRLTEIKIKRISKYNKFKATELIKQIEDELEQVKFDIANLTDFTIAYYQRLLDKYGKGRERKTEIVQMENITPVAVVANNARLYTNMEEGFVGTGLKKDTFVKDCSDMDDIIGFTKGGIYKVVRIEDKVFIGKPLVHVDVWKKGDKRTTYDMIYTDGKTGVTRAKRFNVSAVTRAKDYDLTKGTPRSKVHYFTANPNGETAKIQIQLSQGCKAKKKTLEFDFSSIDIKGSKSQGNIVTKYPIRKVTVLETGTSSLGAVDIYMDEVSGRLNKEGRGIQLGAFDSDDLIIQLLNNGTYELWPLDMNKKFDPSRAQMITKWDPEQVITAIYYDPEKDWTMVKRFNIESTKPETPYIFITEASGSKLYAATIGEGATLDYVYKDGRKNADLKISTDDLVDIKGWKAKGNKLRTGKLVRAEFTPPIVKQTPKAKGSDEEPLKPGDVIELDF